MMLTFSGLRRPILLGLTGVAAVALSACHKHEEAGASSPMSSTPASAPTIREGRLVLSAVTGNPAAAYFTLTNGATAATIASVA